MKNAIGIICLILTSCGAVKVRVNAERTEILKPDLNQRNSTEIGETLIAKEIGYKYNAIKLLNDALARDYYVRTEIEKGQVLINDWETQEHSLYTIPDKNFGIAISKQGGETKMFVSNDGMHVNLITLKDNIEYEKTEIPITGREYFKQEFIYNGKVGNGIKFIYREFVDNTARPAFTQDLQYDLSESDVIGFKGLRIKVINATNTKIEYEVQSNFTK
ncbi:MAG: hypothetical protein ACOVNP_00290 [Flavobacterium sp.]